MWNYKLKLKFRIKIRSNLAPIFTTEAIRRTQRDTKVILQCCMLERVKYFSTGGCFLYERRLLININDVSNHFTSIFFCRFLRDYWDKGAIHYVTIATVTCSRVKITRFCVNVHLVFYWCLHDTQ